VSCSKTELKRCSDTDRRWNKNEDAGLLLLFFGPTSTKPQAEILKLNNVNGCNDISFGDHSILEGDRIPPLKSRGQACYYYY